MVMGMDMETKFLAMRHLPIHKDLKMYHKTLIKVHKVNHPGMEVAMGTAMAVMATDKAMGVDKVHPGVVMAEVGAPRLM